MNGKDLFYAMQHLNTKTIIEAEFGAFSPKEFEKEIPRKRTSIRKSFLIAAIVALLCLLMGCAIVLKMRNLEIGKTLDWDGQPRPVLTFSGMKGTENYQAVKEWLEFTQNFDSTGAHKLESPHPYECYHVLYQEQADKLEEIAASHGLRLAGTKVEARSPRSLMAYLNLSSPLLPDSQAVLSDQTAEYYDGGIFYTDFYLLMVGGKNCWCEDSLCLFYYTPKTCMDNNLFSLTLSDDWREWNYTTSSGDPLLILRSDDSGEAYLFRDHPEATTAVKVYTNGFSSSMTDEQLQQIADQFNFSLNPQPGDKTILAGFGGDIDTTQSQQTQSGYTLAVKSIETDGELAYVTLTITAPEGISLREKEIHPGNRGEGLMLPKEKRDFPYLSNNWFTQEDTDGKANTMELKFSVDPGPTNGTAFRSGDVWSLYIEGLDICDPNTMLQSGVLWQVDGVWQFDIVIPEEDFPAVEFLEAPLSLETKMSGNAYTVTMTSLKLRRYSASAVFDGLAGSLANYEADTFPQVVLKDGTKIPLYHVGGPGSITRLSPEREIPLKDVEYVELTDGTKLYPQKPE